jgi:predicted extracellular nuclease
VTASFELIPVLVISQVYGGGGNSGAPLQNDYIEIYNRGPGAVNLTGWTVQYASAAGTTWQTTPLAGSIVPGGYYLVQEAAGANPAPHCRRRTPSARSR